MTAESAFELLTVAAMYRADARAMEGVPGFQLMRAAGEGLADIIHGRWPEGRILVLAGPGNNGGDGFVAAERLKTLGREVRLALLGDVSRLKGDAATAYDRWRGDTEPAGAEMVAEADIIVDALFGAGLDRPLEGKAAALVDAANAARHTGQAKILAVDMPSGVSGDTGAVMGTAIEADLTITFFRKKPGHVLWPGRGLAGEVRVIDIGIPEEVLPEVAVGLRENDPSLWLGQFPWPAAGGHKYDRGHAVVVSGPLGASGAARLAARPALRIGAGLVTVASPPDAMAENAAQLTAVMLHAIPDQAAFEEFIGDSRRNAILVGPGNGIGEVTRGRVLAALGLHKRAVLDADALTSFADAPPDLFKAIGSDCVLTPHAGEFARLFKDVDLAPGKIEAARAAARASGAVVLFKGPDTVVAAPDGRAMVTTNAPPNLATAGAGDVLGGFITGLLAQGMPAFEAANAAAWIHGRVAAEFGPGLISEDLSEGVPSVLKELKAWPG